MGIETVGTANHVHKDKSVSVLNINIIESDEGEGSWVAISEYLSDSSIVVNSIEQWEQVDAFVRGSLEGLK